MGGPSTHGQRNKVRSMFLSRVFALRSDHALDLLAWLLPLLLLPLC